MKPLFMVAPWNNPFNNQEWLLFRVGTCYGQWRSTDTDYEILAIANENPGNGDFDTTMEYFYVSCKRDKRNLIIREVWNTAFKKHLINKRGFEKLNKTDVIKRF